MKYFEHQTPAHFEYEDIKEVTGSIFDPEEHYREVCHHIPESLNANSWAAFHCSHKTLLMDPIPS
jgi:hypothetical protein